MPKYDMRTCDFFWFLSYRNEFVEKHFAKRVLIRNKEVLGFYDTYIEAYVAARERGFKQGEYYVGLCVYEEQEEEYGFEPVLPLVNASFDDVRAYLQRKREANNHTS